MAKTRFHSLLKDRVRKLVDDRAASLARGACADYAQYQYNVGYILGAEDVLKICSDIEGEIDS